MFFIRIKNFSSEFSTIQAQHLALKRLIGYRFMCGLFYQPVTVDLSFFRSFYSRDKAHIKVNEFEVIISTMDFWICAILHLV